MHQGFSSEAKRAVEVLYNYNDIVTALCPISFNTGMLVKESPDGMLRTLHKQNISSINMSVVPIRAGKQDSRVVRV